MDQVEEIKRKTDIVSLISEYVELKKAGRNYKGLCPFHQEKTPSFMVTPELQIFKCFGCGQGGDVYKFLQEIEKIDFPQALRVLADRAGVKLVSQKGFATFAEKDELYALNFLASEFYHYLLTTHKVGEVARLYLKNRGINADSIKTFKLGFSPQKPDAVFSFLTKKRGYSPKLLEKAGIAVQSRGSYFDRLRGRIIFPLTDHFGNVLGFAGRVIKAQGDVAKYINSPETLVYKKGKILYGLDIARREIKKQGFAVIVEGEIDCISCWQVGIENVVAIKGSALTQDQAMLLARFTDTLILALDTDFAGNEAARRGLEIAQNQGLTVNIASLGEYKDPDEAARNNPEGLKKAISDAQNIYDFLISLVFEKIDVSTTEGKGRASRELSPILAKIDDEIVRASCVKVVAARLGVSEEVVLAQVRKIPTEDLSGFGDKETPEVPPKKERRQLLEERLLSLLLLETGNFLSSPLLTFVKTPAIQRLVAELTQVFKIKADTSLGEVSDKLSPELGDLFSIIVLSQSEFDDLVDVSHETKRIKNELEILDLREEISRVSLEIKKVEAENKEEKVLSLERELSLLGEKLSNLEASVI